MGNDSRSPFPTHSPSSYNYAAQPLQKINAGGETIDRIKPLRAGVNFMSISSGNNIGGSVKVCFFTYLEHAQAGLRIDD